MPFVSQLLLEIDADAVVELGVRAVDVEVGQAYFNDLADCFARFLVGRDPHSGTGVLRLELGTDRPRKAEDAISRELVIGVDFVSVDISHGNARCGLRRDRTTFRLLRAHEGLVEKPIRGQMLVLLRVLANVESDSGGMGHTWVIELLKFTRKPKSSFLITCSPVTGR